MLLGIFRALGHSGVVALLGPQLRKPSRMCGTVPVVAEEKTSTSTDSHLCISIRTNAAADCIQAMTESD